MAENRWIRWILCHFFVRGVLSMSMTADELVLLLASRKLMVTPFARNSLRLCEAQTARSVAVPFSRRANAKRRIICLSCLIDFHAFAHTYGRNQYIGTRGAPYSPHPVPRLQELLAEAF